MAKPLIRWVGGKSRLLPTLREHLPAGIGDLRHVELFAGSGALFFDRARTWHGSGGAADVLADICQPLIHTYIAVRDNPAAVLRSLAALSRYQQRRDYERIRRRFNATIPDGPGDPKRAAAFLYLNAVGFNGIWRENAAGEINTPFGEWPNGGIHRRERILEVSEALRGVKLRAVDALTFNAESVTGAGDFIYLDPPYLPRNQSSFRGYSAGGFRLREHADLARLAERLADRGAQVMISNADTWVARELYRGLRWYVHSVKTHTSVAAKGRARGAQAEILITNYPVQRKRSHERAGGSVAVTHGGRRGVASAAQGSVRLSK